MGKQYIQILDLISDDVNDKFIVTIYGKSKEGENVVVNVIDFEPFFYVRVPPGWNQHTAIGFFKNIKFIDKKFTTDSNETEFDIKMEYEKNKYYNFYTYDEKTYDFLKFSFKSHDMMKKMTYKVRRFYEECKTDMDPDKKSFYELNDEGGEFRFDSNLYESNIHPLLRFIHDRNIQPSGWIEFTYKKSNVLQEKKQIYNCNKQYDDIPYESINYHEYDEISRYVIASFDIECDSSHGDFPSAKKDFKKLSMYIVDEYLSKGLLYEEKSLFDYIKDILIKSICSDGIIKKDDEEYITYVSNGPLKEESIIKSFLDEKQEGDIDIGEKSYDMNKKFIELQTALKNNKRNDAIEILNRKKNKPGILSYLKNDKGEKLKVKGDPIIQIGTVFYTYGKPDSYDRHILVIGPQPNMKAKDICSKLENIKVIRYDSELDLLQGWVELMEKHNPDYITGYNIFGFDFDYMIGRVSELYDCKPECKFNMFSKSMDHCYNCPTNRFYNLGRLNKKNDYHIYKNNKCKRCKSIVKKLGGGNDKEEDESTYSHDTLKYIHMDGRIIFDVQNEVKKGYSLDSYKLDNVAANFMRGKIKSIRNIYNEDVNNYLIFINTDRIGNLKNGDYISFNVKNNYGDMKYDNGHKFMILNIYHDEKKIILKSDKSLVISKILNLETNDILYSEWCLNKDDISPQELFDKHKWGTGKDRGMIAKYCIMDCELCIHLLLMLDFIPNNIGMSNVCKVPQPYIFLRGQGIKVQSIVTKFAHENKYKIPTLMGYDEELSDNSGFEGAIVLEPKPGLYLDDPIAVVDYASLYPSSIIEKNISHDTYLGDYKDIKDELKEKEYIEGIDYNRIQYDNYEYIQKEGTQVIEKKNVLNADGSNEVMDCVFLSEHNTKVEKKKGIIPMVVGELLSARSATKKRLKLEKDENKKKVLEGFQLAFKLTANSVYGQLGAKTSCLSFKKVAACTTAVGRQKIIDAKKYAYDWALSPYNNMIYNSLKEKYTEQEYIEYYDKIIKLDEDNLLTDKKVKIFNGEEKNHRELECEKYKLLDVIYGDTDSIFIKFSRKITKDNELTKSEAVDHCIQCGLKAGEYITSMLKRDNWPDDKPGYPQDLEYEKTFYPFILISKKRYTGEKYEFSSKEIPKRTSMGLVTKRRDNAPIVKYVFGNMVNRLMSNTRVEDVINWLNQTLNKIVKGKEHISMFVISKTLNSYYKNPQSIAHKVLADRMGQRDPGNKPKANDRIPYAFVKVDDSPIPTGQHHTKIIEVPTGRFKKIKVKEKTGEYLKKEIEIDDGFYKNGKPKKKKIKVNDLDRPKYKTIEKNGDPIMKKDRVFDMERPKFKNRVILQGERIEHVDYIIDNPDKVELDYKLYISNQIMNPVKQLLDVAIDPEETMKIFNNYIQ
jgi:DNA polymerase elongation subunit (family B)